MSTPLVRLASLDLIRGFVAVGRRMSITLASEDLCLTQSAVSRQIQALETALGVKLLLRGHRAITLTPEGERLFRTADSVVQQLQDAFYSLAHDRERQPVTITASIGVTALWLLPRLGRFQQQHASIDVRVAANNKLIDLRQEDVDLAIRYCADKQAPHGALRLFGEAVLPVAHPSFASARLDTPQGLGELVLLEFDVPGRPWLHWADRLSVAGLDSTRARGLLRFNQYDQVIQAAVAGQGIALGRYSLVAPMLADGRLISLDSLPGGHVGGYGYWLIQADTQPRQDVIDVVTWIRAEAAALGAPDALAILA
ncbi:Glycine cleavage system transcriptional activator [plant metagenome]|uniref:Glycine cleavage system transcriptional activator n=1 Tax=plant metagenome TaxID=1297885 RepID=A0A484TIL2_9ZZZZ